MTNVKFTSQEFAELSNEALLDLLENDRTYWWHYAAARLGQLNETRAIEPLLRRFDETPDAALSTILANFGDERAVDLISRKLEKALPFTRNIPNNVQTIPRINCYYYVRALGKLGYTKALPLLESIVQAETQPIFKGKSLSETAAKSIVKIKEKKSNVATGLITEYSNHL